MSNAGWRQIAELATRAQQDGSFVALRGFEWTSPTLGHMNVWFSTNWIDTLSTHGFRPGDAHVPTLPPEAIERAGGRHMLVAAEPPMRSWYEWLQRPVEEGGGADGLIGFNHPDREPERFDSFATAPGLRERLVSMEIFNRHEDYLLRGVSAGNRSPLIECLEAGWRVGLIGVSDDHSANWGFSYGYGRTGLWVRELTRAGVREALLARRVFATRQPGFRLDAAANGVRMGGSLPHSDGPLRIVVDIDGGAEWAGRLLSLQVLGHGTIVPQVKWAAPVRVPTEDQPPIHFDLELRPDETGWLVIRVSDPDVADPTADSAFMDSYGAAVAYSSPFFLR